MHRCRSSRPHPGQRNKENSNEKRMDRSAVGTRFDEFAGVSAKRQHRFDHPTR
jgi:hypothetical protein